MRAKRTPIIGRFICSGSIVAAVALVAIQISGPVEVQAQAEQSASDDSTENYRGEFGVTMAMVREELKSLPNYDVFDWIEAEVFDDGRVVIEGAVVNPTTKEYATTRVARLENVTGVTNRVEVLPLSTGDDQIRLAIYDAIYGPDSPLFRFAGRTLPPVHIIVERGHVTLKGTVDSVVDRQFLAAKARSIPGVFDVENEIQLETRA